jgi:hypothetical protein
MEEIDDQRNHSGSIIQAVPSQKTAPNGRRVAKMNVPPDVDQASPVA